jgi:hypothetical protein
MMKPAPILGLIGLAASLALGVGAANAQTTRSYVSGVGDDANPCSRTAPCKTFAGAITKTAPSGEIDCLDPGGFGQVTITKSIVIDCTSSGLIGGVLTLSGNAINISAPGSNVSLIGLDFNGVGNTASSGIQVNSAAHVTITDSIIYGFSANGIAVLPTTASGVVVDVVRTKVFDNAGNGIFYKPTNGASVRGVVTGSFVSNNGTAGAGDGVSINDNANTTTGSVKIAISNTQSVNNANGNGFAAFSSTGGVAEMVIDGGVASDNTTDIGVTGANATVRFTRTTLTAGTAVNNAGGTAVSYSSNIIDGAVSGTLTTTASQ